MPAIARIDPKTVFTPQEWARLSQRSAWRGLALVAHAWGVIAAAIALVAVWPNPLTVIVAIMLIGARQLGLAILMHEAAHNALHPNHRLIDWVGEWLCAVLVGASLGAYRPYHFRHHRFTETADDPDLALSKPFPTSRASLWRKVARDLTGQTFLKQRFGQLIVQLRGKSRLSPEGKEVVNRAGRRFLLVNAFLLCAAILAGMWWAFALWLVAMATWFPLATRLRNIAEHAVVNATADPFRHARTTRANLIERLFIAPYWVHYHSEHHLFMHLPCWRLEEAHRLLVAKGYAPRMEIRDGYGEVLALAAPVDHAAKAT